MIKLSGKVEVLTQRQDNQDVQLSEMRELIERELNIELRTGKLLHCMCTPLHTCTRTWTWTCT